MQELAAFDASGGRLGHLRTAQFMLLEFCPTTLEAFAAGWEYPMAWEDVSGFAVDLCAFGGDG